ncbi:hypothetical protein BDN67DRAFT_908136, partial [Paxillus ammoniavirescens]
LSSKFNEYSCDVEEDYVLDGPNLTSLTNEVSNNAQTLDPIADIIGSSGHFLQITCHSYHLLDDDRQSELTDVLNVQACLVYSRRIIMARGLAKMLENFKIVGSDRCARVGLSDIICHGKSVKQLYFGRCEDVYSPK